MGNNVRPLEEIAKESEDGSIIIATWPLTTANDTGISVQRGAWADRSVQVEAEAFAAGTYSRDEPNVGTWSAGDFGGATVVIEGSNNGRQWQALHDPSGVALSFTAGGLKAVLEVTKYIRARLSVAGTDAAISATLLVRRPNMMRQ